MKQVSRTEMVKAVKENIRYREALLEQVPRNSLEAIGCRQRLHKAQVLLERLEQGGRPTTNEVVGYFGKGARYEE